MKKLFKALADFQQEVPVIAKNAQGYGYKFADLPTILETINPLLKKHGLGFIQQLDGTSLVTTIFHVESEQTLTGSVDIPQNVQLKGMNDFQVLGSAITYMRRYALSSALGLVTDVDNDAHGEQTKPQSKPAISPERFQKAIDLHTEGKISKSKLLSNLSGFTLSDLQKKSLELLKSELV